MYGIWDFTCPACGITEERLVPKEDTVCSCGAEMERQFSKESVRGYQPFEAYFDEGLGMDIHGHRERREAMRSLGLQEAGDRVGGARNEEKSKLATTAGRDATPTGLRLSDVQRSKERPHDPKFGVEDKNGKVTWVRGSDLSAPPAPTQSREERKKMIHQIASERISGD